MAPVEEPQSETTKAIRLLWHVCHLCNVSISQLGAYLSLEALHRDSANTGLTVPIPHHPMMAAQAALLVDNSKNMEAAADALVRTMPHRHFLNDPAYRSLLDATKGLSAIIEAVQNGITCRGDVDVLRSAYEEMTELCYGNSDKNIRGWKECWNEVFGFNEQ
ncbi:hypothetical protein LTR85_009943 [Meristemomyces frigidus]|nr:hypothetical protein LTR85_009943 [Meristemomyces frigidus]